MVGLKVAQKETAGRAPQAKVTLNVDINSHVRTHLRTAAELDGVPMPEKLHEILCEALNLDPSRFPSPGTLATASS